MKKVELEKHKFDQLVKFGIFLALLGLAVFLEVQHSSMVGEIVGVLVGFAGGSVASK